MQVRGSHYYYLAEEAETDERLLAVYRAALDGQRAVPAYTVTRDPGGAFIVNVPDGASAEDRCAIVGDIHRRMHAAVDEHGKAKPMDEAFADRSVPYVAGERWTPPGWQE